MCNTGSFVEECCCRDIDVAALKIHDGLCQVPGLDQSRKGGFLRTNRGACLFDAPSEASLHILCAKPVANTGAVLPRPAPSIPTSGGALCRSHVMKLVLGVFHDPKSSA